MTIYTLSHGSLKLDVSDQGGVIEGFWRDTTPLLRPGKKSGVATDASCFPLVPFANRVSGNRFVWQGREYQLQPNVEWDAHYLHGDGWRVSFASSYRRNWILTSPRRCRASG